MWSLYNVAPPIGESCSFDAMIEYVTIKNQKVGLMVITNYS